MPKTLFFTISEEKQKKIIEAALTEFSKEKFHEASINQIVKNANISRGSFYQYFTDKEDLFFFILEDIIDSVADHFIQKYISVHPLDISTFYRELLTFNLKLLSSEKYKGFFTNMYMSMNYQFLERLKEIYREKRAGLLSNQHEEMVIKSEYEERYFTELMNIMELINRDLMIMKISNGLSDQEILEIFDLRMKILRVL